MKRKSIVKKMLTTTSMAMILSFTACSDSEANNTDNTEVVTTESHDDEATNKESSGNSSDNEEVTTEEKIDVDKKSNPLGFSSQIYNKTEKENFLDKDENVRYIASIIMENKADDEREYVGISIDGYDEDTLLIDYIYATEHELAEGIGGETHLELYDKDTGKILKKLVFSIDGVYIDKKSETICVEIMKDGILTVQSYDYQLNEIAKFVSKDDETSINITNDGKRFYYVKEQKLCMYDSQKNISKEFKSDNKFIPDSITDVVTDERGNDYILFDGMAADYNTYKFIYDATKENIVRVDECDINYESQGSFLINSQLNGDDFYYMSWLVGLTESKAFNYDITEEIKENEETVTLIVMQNGDLMFYKSVEDNMYIDVYEKNTGKLKGSTSFNVSGILREPLSKLPEGEIQNYSKEMSIYDKPVYVSDRKLLFTLIDHYGTKYYFEWNMQNSVDNKMITVAGHEFGSIKAVDISCFDGTLLIPGELSDGLKPLNEEVNRLEKKYDMSIKIGEECSDIFGGYIVYPLTDYELVKDAINALEEELEVYPEKFFSQFKYQDIDGLEIYISSDIMGLTGHNLDIAGGFACPEDGKIKIVIDCDSSEVLDATFHHELSHAIDEVITYNHIYGENDIFSEEKWNALNPFEDMYSNTYEEWGKAKYWDDYVYDNIMLKPGYSDGEIGAYFVDAYAMTYPTEDRARLFENIMRDNGAYVDFSKSPYLRAKINYYAECIRANFDTTGWGEVPWEAYME